MSPGNLNTTDFESEDHLLGGDFCLDHRNQRDGTSGQADTSYRTYTFTINRTVTIITLKVADISSSSEILLDDLEIREYDTTSWRAGEIDLGGDWKWSSWFGYYNTTFDPWVYHMQHHWLYPFDAPGGGVFFWDVDMSRFWWTKGVFYPSMYRFPIPRPESDPAENLAASK